MVVRTCPKISHTVSTCCREHALIVLTAKKYAPNKGYAYTCINYNYTIVFQNLRKEQEYSIIDYVGSRRYPMQAGRPST